MEYYREDSRKRARAQPPRLNNKNSEGTIGEPPTAPISSDEDAPQRDSSESMGENLEETLIPGDETELFGGPQGEENTFVPSDAEEPISDAGLPRVFGPASTISIHPHGSSSFVENPDLLLQRRAHMLEKEINGKVFSPTGEPIVHTLVALHLRLLYQGHDSLNSKGYPKMDPDRHRLLLELYSQHVLQPYISPGSRVQPTPDDPRCQEVLNGLYPSKNAYDAPAREKKKDLHAAKDPRYINSPRHVTEKVKSLLRIAATYPDDSFVSGGHGCLEAILHTVNSSGVAVQIPLVPEPHRESLTLLLEYLLSFREQVWLCESERQARQKSNLTAVVAPPALAAKIRVKPTLAIPFDPVSLRAAADQVMYDQHNSEDGAMTARAQTLRAIRTETREETDRKLSGVVLLDDSDDGSAPRPKPQQPLPPPGSGSKKKTADYERPARHPEKLENVLSGFARIFNAQPPEATTRTTTSFFAPSIQKISEVVVSDKGKAMLFHLELLCAQEETQAKSRIQEYKNLIEKAESDYKSRVQSIIAEKGGEIMQHELLQNQK